MPPAWASLRQRRGVQDRGQQPRLIGRRDADVRARGAVDAVRVLLPVDERHGHDPVVDDDREVVAGARAGLRRGRGRPRPARPRASRPGTRAGPRSVKSSATIGSLRRDVVRHAGVRQSAVGDRRGTLEREVPVAALGADDPCVGAGLGALLGLGLRDRGRAAGVAGRR